MMATPSLGLMTCHAQANNEGWLLRPPKVPEQRTWSATFAVDAETKPERSDKSDESKIMKWIYVPLG